MQRRALSPLGLKRQRIGRKAMSSARMLHGIEKKLGPNKKTSKDQADSPQEKKHSKLPHYRFRRWHAFALLIIVAVGIIGNFGYSQYQQAQTKEQQKQAAIKQKAEIKASDDRRACYKKAVAEKAKQINTLTYDQLYGGTCD